MKKHRKQGIFTVVVLYSVVACVISSSIAIGSGIFLYDVDVLLSEQNLNQQKEFGTSKNVLDTVDAQYIARFDADKTDSLKTKLAQQGFTSLLDTSHIRALYGYDEIDRILANQTVEPKNVTAVSPKGYNWPVIRLVSMMYNATICTTMIEFSGGENKSEQRRQIWKWEHKNGEWVPISFSKYFIPSAVEITKQGVSFMLSPRNNTKLTKLFVLKK
jgi:hypothetical protein